MTQEEFGKLTPGMFTALLKRKQARFREEQYLAGLTASMVANTAGKMSTKVWTPWDFVPDPKAQEVREKLKEHIVAAVNVAFALTTQNMDEIRAKIIERLEKQGEEDVREIFEEAFPKWRELSNGNNSRNAGS